MMNNNSLAQSLQAHTSQLNPFLGQSMRSVSPPLSGNSSGASSLNHQGVGNSSPMVFSSDLKSIGSGLQYQSASSSKSILEGLLQNQGLYSQPFGLLGASNRQLTTNAINSLPLLLNKQLQNAAAACNLTSGNLISGMSKPLPSPWTLVAQNGPTKQKRGGVIEPFPEKLHRLLREVEAAGRSDVISFIANGQAFAIHKPDVFFKEIVPLYFRQSRLSSFKRQLNLYGFELITTGPSRGGYYHQCFSRHQPELCRKMRRVLSSNKRAEIVTTTKDNGEVADHDIKTSSQ